MNPLHHAARSKGQSSPSCPLVVPKTASEAHAAMDTTDIATSDIWTPENVFQEGVLLTWGSPGILRKLLMAAT